MKIYFVRHGQTANNRKNMLQGRAADPELNETGIRQAEEAGEWFAENGISFDAVYSSPLRRAVRTAEIIAERAARGTPVRIRIDERLIEMDYGPYEGADLTHMPEELRTFFADLIHNPAPEGMETLQEVTARAASFLAELREESKKENVLIAAHAVSMKGALEYLTPGSGGSYWPKFLANCAVYETELRPDGTFSVPVEVFAPRG